MKNIFTNALLSLSVALMGGCFANTSHSPCTFPSGGTMVSLDQCFDFEGASKLSVVVLPQLEYDPVSNLASVRLGDGWAYANRSGEIVFRRVLSFDNGAEPFKDGRLRVVVNGKYGFADSTGAVVVPATYDGAFAFENGYAPVCTGCVVEESGEYHEIVGGKWSCIDPAGQSVEDKNCESIDGEE